MTNAKEIHQRAPVADGHADSLMWNRDLNEVGSGHVDFPRLLEAGVKIQCFTIVTRGLPIIGGFPLFAWKQNWPAHARASEWARAIWQMDRLNEFCRASNGRARIAATAQQLKENLEVGRLSAILGIEGGHVVEGDATKVRELYARGVRFMSLTHLGNNELGGSSFPFVPERPLSKLGQEVLEEMATVGMSVDLAHASPKTLQDILRHRTAKFFCSHSGAAGATKHWRNLPDEALRAIAERGGVVGIIFAPAFIGGAKVENVVKHIEYAMNVMGEDHVGYGSDFDGFIPLPKPMKDVRDLHLIMERLLERGHKEALVEKIVGGNFRRFFEESLAQSV